MGLRKYIIFGLIFLVLSAIGAFINSSGDFRLIFFSNVYVLPVAIWVVMPAFVLFIASILHIFIYSVRHYFDAKAFENDEKALKALIRDLILGKKSSKVFKTKEFSEIGEILGNFNLIAKEKSTTTNDAEINNLLTMIHKINAGQFVSPKELKLQNDSSLYEKNILNEINEDINFAIDVVRKSSAYSFDSTKAAILKILAEKNIATIIKYIDEIKIDREIALALFDKDSQKNTEVSFSQDKIAELAKKAELCAKDFIAIAKFYKNRMGPDELIRLFENLSSVIDEATEAYLYILFEFEMIDAAKEVLLGSTKNEFVPYKALLDLKHAGKHYSIDTLCKI